MTEQDTPIHEKPTRSEGAASKSNYQGLGCLALFMVVPLTCCALMVACCAILFGLAAASESNAVTRSQTETLEVVDREAVTLEVNNTIGETVIYGDEVASIQVEVDLRATGLTKDRAQTLLDSIEVDIRRTDDRYLVNINNPEGGAFSDQQADLRITVPETLNLMVNNNIGLLRIEDVTIRDELNLVNNVGEIHFQGALLSETGNYSIQTDVGAIYVEIDSDSPFRLDATSHVGEIRSDLDLRQATHDREGVGHHLAGVYGEAEDPQATLTLITNVGQIEIED